MAAAQDSQIDSLMTDVASSALAALADVLVLVDSASIVVDTQVMGEQLFEVASWRGQPFADLVSADTRAKAADLLAEAPQDHRVIWRQLNQIVDVGQKLQIPMEYAAIPVPDTKQTLLCGRNMQNIAELHDRLMLSQIAIEAEYERFRTAENRYRDLMEISPHPVLLIDPDDMSLLEANVAARSFFTRHGVPAIFGKKRAVDGLFTALLSDDAHREFLTWLAASARSGQRVTFALTIHGHIYDVTASLQAAVGDMQPVLIVQLSSQNTTVEPDAATVLHALKLIPEAIALIDSTGSIRSANPSMLELLGVAKDSDVIHADIDRWLEQPGMTSDTLFRRAQEFGTIRSFTFGLRHESGAVQLVEASATIFDVGGGNDMMALILRPGTTRSNGRSESRKNMQSVANQMTNLVGQMSMKEIVREATDVIEDMCIEAALELSDDNRVAAAELLGVSRQSFYMKLRRSQSSASTDTDGK